MEKLTAGHFGADGNEAAQRIGGIIESSHQTEKAIAVWRCAASPNSPRWITWSSSSEIYRVFSACRPRPPAILWTTRPAAGKWYYEGDGRNCFSRLDGYTAMEAPHLAVHKHGRGGGVALFGR